MDSLYAWLAIATATVARALASDASANCHGRPVPALATCSCIQSPARSV